MSDSILNSTKKILGIEPDYTVFDVDVITHINSALARLNSLGIGPEYGFSISDATPTWDDFLGGDPRLNQVKTYVYLKVRLVFDPPSTSFYLESMNQQIAEQEFLLNVHRESTAWVNPLSPLIDGEESVVLDGGVP